MKESIKQILKETSTWFAIGLTLGILIGILSIKL